MIPTASERTEDRDVMTLAFLREAGRSSVTVVTAHLLFEGSFAGSKSPSSRESATRASLDRLIAAGQVERDTTSKPYRYAAKGLAIAPAVCSCGVALCLVGGSTELVCGECLANEAHLTPVDAAKGAT